MSDTLHDEKPDPSRASTPAEFVAQLNQLRRWAGEPSLRTLKALAGPRPGAGHPPSEALPTSTTHEILAGKRLPRLPRLDFVEHFVTACLRAARCPAGDIDDQLEKWRRSWRALTDPPASPAPDNVANHTAATSDPPRDVQRTHRNLLGRRMLQLAVGLMLFVGGGVAGAATATYLRNDQNTGQDRAGPPPFECPEQRAGHPPAGTQLVANGTFDDGKWSWWDKNHTVRTYLEDTQLRIVVIGRTTQPHKAIVEQRGIPLRDGRVYTLSFDMSANHIATIRAAVQMQYQPFSRVVAKDIKVGPTPCRFTFTGHSAGVATDKGVVTFHLGGHETEHSYLLDNVSLIEHAERPLS